MFGETGNVWRQPTRKDSQLSEFQALWYSNNLRGCTAILNFTVLKPRKIVTENVWRSPTFRESFEILPQSHCCK